MKYYNRNQINSIELIKKRIHIVFSNNNKLISDEIPEGTDLSHFLAILKDLEWFGIEEVLEQLKTPKKAIVVKPKTIRKKKTNKD